MATVMGCSLPSACSKPPHARFYSPLENGSFQIVTQAWRRWTKSTSLGFRTEGERRMHCRRTGAVKALGQRVAQASASVADMGGKTDIPPGSVSVVLLSGGVGKRMGANMPKQYLPLLGQPIALYSLCTFAGMEEIGEIVVVCDPTYRALFEDAAWAAGIVGLKFALPGKERQDSVFNGLQAISPSGQLACIHDSARPLVTAAEVRAVIHDAWTHGAAVLGVPCKATIKTAGQDSFVKQTLDRKTLWEMQTPQVIEPELLKRGFDLVNREGLEVTDDVSIVEHLKHKVFITQGEYTNLKVTTPEDLILAEAILSQQKQRLETRVATAAAA